MLSVITLGNRPAVLAPRTRLYDFQEGDRLVRVSLRLQEARESDSDNLVIDAQAFEVDPAGLYIVAPDGRPSRTGGTKHVIYATSLGDTHSLHAGWVRIVGDYNASTFEATAARGDSKPISPPDFETNPTGQFYDEVTGIGYRWVEGEVASIAKGKAEELLRIARNSNPLSGIDF